MGVPSIGKNSTFVLVYGCYYGRSERGIGYTAGIARLQAQRMTEPPPDKTIIGLTGNIAMGKSTVLELLAQQGADVIDADRVAHAALRQDGAAYAAVVAEFGRHILGADGDIDRTRLGAIVFAQPARLRELERITHPAIRQEIYRALQSAESPLVVIEAIKLLEGELRHWVDAVWVVNAPRKLQLQRLMQQRGMSRAQAEQRIDQQNSQADKLDQADVVIENDGDIAGLRAQLARLWAP